MLIKIYSVGYMTTVMLNMHHNHQFANLLRGILDFIAICQQSNFYTYVITWESFFLTLVSGF